MIGKMEGDQKYVAVGFSNDKQMGDDSVIACIYDEDKGTTAVHQYYNSEDPLTSGQIGSSGLVKEGATYANSTIWCRFTRTITSSDAKMMKPLNNEYHILFAKGPVASGAVGKHGFDYYGGPAVSPQRTNLIKTDNIGGRASYPLVKAHGILMILAWVLTSSIAIILLTFCCFISGILMILAWVLTSSIAIIFARYFKPMWPNDRLCGERVWFANHRTLQINTLILTIIAFILIFIEVMGYSNMDSPGFAVAHPIIGIIVTILCVLNPIMALFRCHPEDDYRPIFNWFHWIVGTVAHILATINIFFGMNLAKSGVPWWVTWVMLIWVLIQFITEITLEIHQCCVHKRNKDKREQWEMQKRTDPRAEKVPEPEPSGRRFKSTMLAIYITLTVILVIIMVIAIAVS
ncbi:putative ferric-chelate reductase 1 homolog [Lingula anatina]|uniref:Ferric-chelate reductase 1 homolog n=1 Tax=Lingula anatina TaxID=7574 RepID=A0A1S3IZS9_LINAN|nr:putative ferric-chelate reductase 1 homolog [Lingula anatina]|eukprot:XP_013403700.1 putative ferric-chelate reductase 1 homolog [Lingula anatina]